MNRIHNNFFYSCNNNIMRDSLIVPRIKIQSLKDNYIVNIQEEADKQLNGIYFDPCDCRNDKSCFAIEVCANRSNSKIHITDLIKHSHVLLASTPESAFAGIVCIEPAAINDMIRMYVKEKDSIYLHTLCTSENERNKGVAKVLMNTVESMNRRVYLSVRKPVVAHHKLLENLPERFSNLLQYYKKRRYKIIGETNSFIIMKK